MSTIKYQSPFGSKVSQHEVELPAHANIGRMAQIRVRGSVVVGNVIDLVADTQYPKRIRIQHGLPELAGAVVQPHEYEFLWFCDQEED